MEIENLLTLSEVAKKLNTTVLKAADILKENKIKGKEYKVSGASITLYHKKDLDKINKKFESPMEMVKYTFDKLSYLFYEEDYEYIELSDIVNLLNAIICGKNEVTKYDIDTMCEIDVYKDACDLVSKHVEFSEDYKAMLDKMRKINDALLSVIEKDEKRLFDYVEKDIDKKNKKKL